MDYLYFRELYHHGIKGQKWGVRRYQYEDGSLTAEGRKRYNVGAPEDLKEVTKKGNKYYYKDADGNEHVYKTNVKDLDDKEITDLLKRIKLENSLDKEVASKQTNKAKDSKDILDSSAKVLDATARALPTGNGKLVKKDYSNLSDQELRNKISRLQLEESYGRLSGDTKYVKSGSEKAREILQTAGAVIAIGASAAALTATIIDIRNKNKNLIQSDMSDFLNHHGIKGQKWGVRRFQNEDGSLTPDGQKRYNGKTHINQLTDFEKQDLNENDLAAAKRNKNKKILIGAGVITAATISLGAAWFASKYSAQKTELNIMKKQESDRLAKNADNARKRRETNAAKLAAGIPLRKSTTFVQNLGNMILGPVNNATINHNERSRPMDYLYFRELYHNSFIEEEKQRRKRSLKIINKDFFRDLPSEVCDVLNSFCWDYSIYNWFDEAWEKYRKHVLDAGLGGKIKMPGFIFNSYIDKHVEDMYKKNKKTSTCESAYYADCDVEELYHHGIKGQKWGVRRFQNEDGSYTSAGKARYQTDLGTKEMIKNSSDYDKLTRKQQKQYKEYGKRAGAKKGFLVGLGTGAAIGLGKTIADVVIRPGASKNSKGEPIKGTSLANRFIRNTLLGGLGGAIVGGVAGSFIGKKSAQAKLADRGKEYVDELLQTPTRRIEEE